MSLPPPPGSPTLGSIELVPADTTRVSPDDWEQRCAEIRDELGRDGLDAALLEDVVKDITFLDDDGRSVAFDGARWWSWVGSEWVDGRPTGTLRPTPLTMHVLVVPERPDLVDEPDGTDADADDEAPDAYVVTNVVPIGGLVGDSGDVLAAGLDVMVTEWRTDGWAHVRCSNGWSTWVDGRALESPGEAVP
jgi:hypothetical protein